MSTCTFGDYHQYAVSCVDALERERYLPDDQIKGWRQRCEELCKDNKDLIKKMKNIESEVRKAVEGLNRRKKQMRLFENYDEVMKIVDDLAKHLPDSEVEKLREDYDRIYKQAHNDSNKRAEAYDKIQEILSTDSEMFIFKSNYDEVVKIVNDLAKHLPDNQVKKLRDDYGKIYRKFRNDPNSRDKAFADIRRFWLEAQAKLDKFIKNNEEMRLSEMPERRRMR